MELMNDMNYRGKMGKLVYYTMNGKTFVRRVRIPGKKRKPRTTKQKELSGRFGMAQKMYSFYRETISPDIWRLAGKAVGRRGNMLFVSVNSGCFEAGMGIASPETFRFSEGELLLPWGMQVEALGSGRFRAMWTDERELATAAANDRLKVGVFYPGTPKGVYWAEEMSGTRGDGCGEFRINTNLDAEAHVYLFFAREDGSAYSPSMHFRLTMNEEFCVEKNRGK